MIGAWVDGFIGLFRPDWQAERIAARRTVEMLSGRSYEGGKRNRRAPWFGTSESGEPLNRGEAIEARQRAWDLYRNNHYARKAVRALIAQVVGCGMTPESLAVKADGTPDDVMRRSLKTLWQQWNRRLDYRGPIGQGGASFDQLAVIALREVILSGEVFIRKHYRDGFRIELVHCTRVAEESNTFAGAMADGNYIYRGVEFDKSGRRVAYHLYDYDPQDPRPVDFQRSTTRVLAEELIHLFIQERPDQIRGVTWFAPIVMQLRDIKDFQENEMVAAAVGACVTMAIKTSTRAGSATFATPTGASSTDGDGNNITRMQPGTIFRLRPEEDIVPFNPQRPQSSAEGFINHMLRGMAGGLPGLKASTLTGDYRNSSFSSERSADNDCWRETEQVQEWMASAFYQPIWEELATLELQGRPEFTREAREAALPASWHGPVAKAINPADDFRAYQLGIELGVESLPSAAAANGQNWVEMLEQKALVYQKLKELGLPNPDELRMQQAQMEMELAAAQAEQAKASAAVSSAPVKQVRRVTPPINRFMGPNGEDLSARGVLNAE